ncbi:hypothetical protein [Brevundimonas bullata]
MDEPKKLSPLGNDQHEVERVAKAIYQVQVQSARRSVAEIEFDLDEMKRVIDVAIAESDRAASILLFSYAEDMMVEGIKRNLKGDLKGGFKSLLAPNGLLATAHNRTTLLAALRWISTETYEALNVLRSIRNRFAHHVACDSFDDKVISGMVTSLPAFEKPITEQTREKFVGMRQVYLARSLLTVYRVMHEVAVLPHAMANHVDPRDVGGPYEDRPASVHELGLAAADCLLKLVPGNRAG